MAEIATAAGLSVGQIYRFFENKEALIEAITDLQMDELRDSVAEVEARDGAAGAIRLLLAKGIEKLRRPGVAALMLEVTAEAARNPKVAAVVQAHDRRIREAISDLIAKAQGLGLPEDADCRAQMMCLIFEGCAARVIRNPELDDAALVAAARLAAGAAARGTGDAGLHPRRTRRPQHDGWLTPIAARRHLRLAEPASSGI